MKNTDNDTSKYFLSKLTNLKNPIILELGVNKGGSTANFLKYINDNGGELYSIDINDCSTQRNLSESGRIQSQKIGSFFTENKISIV